jgi:hypothetical protein
LVFGPAGTLTLYRDGIQVAQATAAGTPQLITPGGFQVGCSGNTNRGGWFTGGLAHFAWYPRALPPAEVSSHYSAMIQAPSPSSPVLVAAPITPTVRQAWLTLGSLLVPLDSVDDPNNGWICTELDLGSPAIREVLTDRPDQHGSTDRTQFMGARVVTASFVVLPDWTMDDAFRQFMPFMDPHNRPTLHLTTFSQMGPGERTLTLRATSQAAPMDYPLGGGQSSQQGREFQLSWTAADPILRDVKVQTQTSWGGSSGVSGRVYNLVFPRVYPVGSGSQVNASFQSNGDMIVKPKLSIYGPVSGPAVSLTTQINGTVYLLSFLTNFRVDAGHRVDIDCDRHTAYYDGQVTQNVLGQIDWSRSTWPLIPPAPDGVTMVMTGTVMTGISQVQATWQDAYLS